VWQGLDGIRQRYEQEFDLRRYRRLRHLNLAVTFRSDNEATVVNDLDALIETNQGIAHVALNRTDRWTLHRNADEWRIVKLEVNRATRLADASAGDQLVITRRQ
jgi:hypothetical protein